MSTEPDGGGGPTDLPLAFVTVESQAYCYGPLADRLVPSELAGSERAQRWSDAGAPTIYLASDPGVALAEWGRHVPLRERRDPSGLWRMTAMLRRAVDLRRPQPSEMDALLRAAGLPMACGREDPAWCLDPDTTRDLAAWLRYAVGVDGLVVPSVAFLDDRSRGNLVLFVDEDDRPAEAMARDPRLIATVRWADDRPSVTPLDTEVQLRARPALGRL